MSHVVEGLLSMGIPRLVSTEKVIKYSYTEVTEAAHIYAVANANSVQKEGGN